jgi:hypothetical protein
MSYHFCDYGLPQKLFDAPNSDIETLLMAGASHLRVFANDNLPSFLTSYSSSALPPDFFAQFAMHVSQISSSVSAIIITYPPPNPPDFTALLYEPKDLKRIAVYVLGETIGNYTALWLVRGRGKSGNCANEGTPTQFAILRWCDPLDERHGPTLEDFISILRSEINS